MAVAGSPSVLSNAILPPGVEPAIPVSEAVAPGWKFGRMLFLIVFSTIAAVGATVLSVISDRRLWAVYAGDTAICSPALNGFWQGL